MTDYNDGKIHGWNGGECPVHPKSVVEYWLREGGADGECADNLAWVHIGHSSDIIAFRVTKGHVEPKTIWVNEYADGPPRAHITENGAKNAARDGATRVAIKYQEVIE